MCHRLTVLRLSLAIGTVVAASASPTTAQERPDIPYVTTRRLYKTEQGGVQDARRLVIRDPTAWRALWDEVVAGISPPQEPPLVDFSQSMVIVVAMGMQNTGGYEISIDDVYRWREAISSAGSWAGTHVRRIGLAYRTD
jgi:hypothetical protein